MSTLFPERQEAVKVLYKAAGELLYTAAEEHTCLSRELCRRRAFDCVELAEKIDKMGTVKIIVEAHNNAISKVEGIPFDLGYVVDMLNSASQEDSQKEPKL